MKNIVVFGASGDTGKYLIDYFVNHPVEDVQPIAVGTRATNYFDEIGVPYYQVDITNRAQFDKLPKDVYAVIDMAGLMPAKMSGYDPQRFVDINITGTMNVLEYCRKNGADRIVYSQSFGDIKDYGDDLLVLSPYLPRKFSFKSDHTVYVLTKCFGMDLMQNYYEMYGLKRFVIRLPNVYMYTPTGETYHVDGVLQKVGFRKLIDQAQHGEPIEIWGDKTRKKDMLYVKDLAQILYKACFADSEGGVFNAGEGVGITLEDQIKGIVEVFSEEGKKSVISENPKQRNAPKYIMDITATVNELGYQPEYADYIKMLKDFKKEMELDRF